MTRGERRRSRQKQKRRCDKVRRVFYEKHKKNIISTIMKYYKKNEIHCHWVAATELKIPKYVAYELIKEGLRIRKIKNARKNEMCQLQTLE